MRKSVIAAVTAIALVMALASASSASALQWSPQNTKVAGSAVGVVHLRTIGAEWVCNATTFTGKTTGSAIVGEPGPAGLDMHACIGPGALSTLVTTAGTWSVNAKSTTTASLSADTSPSGGTVLTINWGGCIATAKGPINVTGLQWSNTTHQLTLPKGSTFPIQPKNCTGFFGSTMEIEGAISFSTLTVIP